MRVLIANDDGIDAPGIWALVRAFAQAGHEVTVAAPDRQRSAASQSMTMDQPISVCEQQVPGAVRAYAIGGTPVDCVKVALNKLCPEAEFVVSGINRGYNVGSDVLYSGTVGAAMEGALCGRAAMAVSLSHEREDLYDLAAKAALDALPLMQHVPEYAVLNLNYPAADKVLGVKAVRLKRTQYLDEYVRSVDEHGQVFYTLASGQFADMREEDDDFTWLSRGYETLTILGYDMNHQAATARLKEAL